MATTGTRPPPKNGRRRDEVSVTQLIRMAIRAEGIVQGVGFRPFVYTLATGLGLTGHVGNDADGVFAEIEGPAAAVSKFLLALERDAPPLARIERVTATAMTPRGSRSFTIAASGPAGQPVLLAFAERRLFAVIVLTIGDHLVTKIEATADPSARA